jgi:acyl carrier protein
MNTEERVMEIFKNIFNLDVILNFEDLTMTQINNWDSVNHLILILSLEEDFGINFSENEIPKMKSFLTICEFINRKVK